MFNVPGSHQIPRRALLVLVVVMAILAVLCGTTPPRGAVVAHDQEPTVTGQAAQIATLTTQLETCEENHLAAHESAWFWYGLYIECDGGTTTHLPPAVPTRTATGLSGNKKLPLSL